MRSWQADRRRNRLPHHGSEASAIPMMLQLVLGNHALEKFFQLGDAAREIVDRLPFGIRQPAMFQNAAFRPDADHATGHSDHGRIIGYGMYHDTSGADFDVVADPDIAQHLRAGSDDHAVPDSGVALA